MTKDEAIAWAVTNIAESYAHEYYINAVEAYKAAEAMTLLSGKTWTVEERPDNSYHLMPPR